MRQSQAIMEKATAVHWQAFTLQMREKIGIEKMILDEPYLPFAMVRAELGYLRRLDKLQQRLTSAKLLQLDIYPLYDGQEGDGEDEDNANDFSTPDDDDDDDEEDDAFDSELESDIDLATDLSLLEFKQDLDGYRQQAFGISQ
jgi:hypothetical protein